MKKIFCAFLGLVLLMVACEQQNVDTWQEQYDLGVRYLSEGNYTEAIIAFTAAIEINPKMASAYVGRAHAYVLSGETEENLLAAQADFEQVIELDDTIVDAWLGLADIYIARGEFDQALEILRQGFEKTGGDISIGGKIDWIEAEHLTAPKIEEMITDFLERQEYLNYEWEYEPDEYAVLDIDGDGVTELIVQGNLINEFYNFMIFRFNSESGTFSPVEIDYRDNYGPDASFSGFVYSGLEYSKEDHAFGIMWARPVFGDRGFQIYTLQGGRLVEIGSINAHYSSDYWAPQDDDLAEYKLTINGDSRELSEEEFNNYIMRFSYVSFQPLE